MKPKNYQRVSNLNPHSDAMQENLVKFFKQLEGCPLIDGRLLEGKLVTAGTASVYHHGLGRLPLGWVVCDVNANAVLHRDAWDETSITFSTSATATYSLWVF